MADDQRPSDLYERDFYLWTQRQAEALRAEAKRHPGSNAVDWGNVATEIEDMGGRDVRECYSRVRTILEHLYKLAWTKRTEPAAGLKTTILTQRQDLLDALTATIRPKVEAELERLHLGALDRAVVAFEAEEPAAERDASLRWTLPQVLGEENGPLS